MSKALPSPAGPRLPVGVAVCDLTPADGPRWGRLRGMALAFGQGAERFVVAAVDGPCGGPATRRELAGAAGLSADRLVVLSGGAGRSDWLRAPLSMAIRRALRQPEEVHLEVGRAWAWELLRPASVDQLLAGQRLERSRRQLAGRAPDARLDALARALNDGQAPPGGPWGERLVDARVHTVSVWKPGADEPAAVLAMLAGSDAFGTGAGRRWATAGARGAAMRQLRGRGGLGDAQVHILRTSSDSLALGVRGREVAARDAVEARQRAERASGGVVRAVRAALGARRPVEGCSLGWRTDGPGSPPQSVGVVTLGELRLLYVPGGVSDALRLDLSEGLAMVPFESADGPLGRLQTAREAHLSGAEETEEVISGGRWLREAVLHLQAPEGAVQDEEVGQVAEAASELVPDLEPAPHLSVVARLGRGGASDGRQLTVEARWRLSGRELAPPGDGWQLRLESWAPDEGWTPAMLGGLPVDDIHQGMRIRRVDGPGGPELRLRWSVAEPRRWKGRQVRLRVGEALGGPWVSAPVKVS